LCERIANENVIIVVICGVVTVGEWDHDRDCDCKMGDAVKKGIGGCVKELEERTVCSRKTFLAWLTPLGKAAVLCRRCQVRR
jgi:hypothetical protein